MKALLQNKTVFIWSKLFAELMSTLSVGLFTSLWGEDGGFSLGFFSSSSGSVTSDEERWPSRRNANVWPGRILWSVHVSDRGGGRRGWGRVV